MKNLLTRLRQNQHAAHEIASENQCLHVIDREKSMTNQHNVRGLAQRLEICTYGFGLAQSVFHGFGLAELRVCVL